MKTILFLTVVCISAFSQNERFVIKKNVNRIKIDGIVSEEEWGHTDALPITVGSPTFKMSPSEKTEIYVTYDEYYFYAAARLYDSEPEKIQENTLKRDDWTNDDGFGIILDTFNDNENAVGFVTSPAGIRIDFEVSNDATGGGFPLNMTWNTYWDAASTRDEKGWFAEIRIPFSSLKFAEKNGQVEMGLLAFRYIIRKNEAHNFPAIDPKYGWGFVKPSLAHDIVLSNIKSKNPVYITPYVLGGRSSEWEKSEAGNSYEKDQKWSKELGIDVKYNITNNLTLDATINTDFAQAEADDEQVNLSQFSLSFPEKRAFFQERSSLFEFKTGGPTQLFYTRQIGLSDSGQVRLLGGARLAGRIGKWDVGLLNMQTEKSEILPAENFGVLSARRSIINSYSNISTMMTSRIGDNGDKNFAYGIGTSIRLGDSDYYINTKLSYTSDTDSIYKENTGFADNTRYLVSFQTRRNKGFGYNAFFLRSGEYYNPEMGFLTRENFTGMGGSLEYVKIFDEKSKFLNHEWKVRTFHAFNNNTKNKEASNTAIDWKIEFKDGAKTGVQLEFKEEVLDEDLELPEDVIVPIGFYEYFSYGVFYDSPFGNLFRYNGGVKLGEFFDGSIFTYNMSIANSFSKYLEASIEYEINSAKFDHRNKKFKTHLMRFKIKSSINYSLSASLFAQYNSDSEVFNINAKVRYNPNEGTDLYLVYQEGYNQNRYREIPTLPVRSDQTILLKYNYTIQY